MDNNIKKEHVFAPQGTVKLRVNVTVICNKLKKNESCLHLIPFGLSLVRVWLRNGMVSVIIQVYLKVFLKLDL